MVARFTDKARRVVSLALAKAKERGDDQIRPVHMLYGVTAADGVGARALAALGVDTAAGERERGGRGAARAVAPLGVVPAAVDRQLGRAGGASRGPLGSPREAAGGDAEALA